MDGKYQKREQCGIFELEMSGCNDKEFMRNVIVARRMTIYRDANSMETIICIATTQEDRVGVKLTCPPMQIDIFSSLFQRCPHRHWGKALGSEWGAFLVSICLLCKFETLARSRRRLSNWDDTLTIFNGRRSSSCYNRNKSSPVKKNTNDPNDVNIKL